MSNDPTIDSSMLGCVTDHHDGHGLAELCVIYKDKADHELGGGASHCYEIFRVLTQEEHGLGDVERPPKTAAAVVQFQRGPRNDPQSTPGLIEGALVAVLIDRMRSLQAGPFACRENALVLTKLEESMHWLKHRNDDRARRGVLGTLKK